MAGRDSQPQGGAGHAKSPSEAGLVAACSLLLGALGLLVGAGCGEGGGAARGATVHVYVAAPLCPGAERELAKKGGGAGGLRVRAICLPDVEADGESRGGRVGKLKLSLIGANARRATEDSSAVGYVGEPTAAATRFSAPILEAADIPQLSQTPGAAAMAELLQALDTASGKSGSLRQAVLDELS